MSSSSFGRYSVIRKIGSGGMAEVFLARSRGAQGTEKLLVIKKIHPALASNERFIDMFVDEARVAMRLNHSNIVQVYAFDQIDGDHFLAMEHVDGCDLHEVQLAARSTGNRLPWGLCAFLAAEIAKGLDYAHSRCDDHGEPLDIVHRDVSPHNVLVSRDGSVKIADFGIAKARSLHEEALGEVKGKLGYMSPEQASGLPVDRRSDIFSLGVVLHEMLTGKHLITSKPGEDLLPTLREGAHPSPSEIDPSVPPELDAVVRKAMAINPGDRYAGAREMAHALSVYLHSERTIYDGHTLESWMGDSLPANHFSPRDTDELTTTVRDEDGLAPEEETVPLRAIGEVEQRAVVLVSARILLEPQPERATVNAELIRLADEISYKADGVLTHTSGGLRIFLGLSHSSMEDAIRGLRLAHDLMDVTRSLSRDNRLRIDIGIAVNRGYVRYRRSAGNQPPTFESEDELIENSRQLLGAVSDGEVVAGGGVYRLTRQEYNFTSTEPVQIMGENADDDSAKQLKVYVVKGARSRRERSQEPIAPGTFLGREFELGRLEEAHRRSTTNKSALLKVVGEMGIGKSRLVRRFVERAGPDKLATVSAECLFVERHTAMATVVAVIRAALGLRDDDPISRLQETMAPFLEEAPSYLQRQVGFFSNLLASPERMWNRAGPNQRELTRRTAFGLGVLLARQAIGSGGLILLVENAHWMDGQSADVLSELASLRSEVPILLLMVGQPGTLADRRIAGLEKLTVNELSDNLIREIVCERLGQGSEIQGITDQIVARAQGNPFFASEIIDSLLERGIISPVASDELSPEGARYRQTRPGAIRLPTTMEGLAASHIDALGSGVRTTLRVASAIGASFTLDTLAGLVGRSVQRDVETLMDRGFLVSAPNPQSGTPMYRFARPMVREAAYTGLSRQDRHRVHRTLADELISGEASGKAVPSSRIAWHLENGGERERAGNYYLKAGKAAMNVYSNRRALRLLDRALSLIPQGTQERFDGLRSRERALKDLGHHQEREATIDEMEMVAQTLGDGPLTTLAANLRSQLLYDMGEYEQAAAAINRAMALGSRYNEIFHKVESLRLLAYTAGQSGHLERALECCNWALDLVPGNTQGLYLRGRVLGVKGAILLEMGDLDRAPFALAESLAVFRRLGKRRNESTAMSNLALAAQARGDLIEGVDLLERAILLDRENKDISARGRKLAATGCIRVEAGDLDQGHSLLEEGLSICRENKELVGEVEAELGLAELWLARSDPQGAVEILREETRRGFLTRSRILQARHRQLLAIAALRVGDNETAVQAADEATRIAKSAGMSGEVVHGAVRRGLALMATEGPQAALAAIDRVDDLVEELGGVRRLEQVRWYQAHVLHQAKDMERAFMALGQAREEVERKLSLMTTPASQKAFESHLLISKIRTGLPD